MAEKNVAQIEHFSQELADTFLRINNLMSHAWVEHEVARGLLNQLLKLSLTHDEWLKKGGFKRGD